MSHTVWAFPLYETPRPRFAFGRFVLWAIGVRFCTLGDRLAPDLPWCRIHGYGVPLSGLGVIPDRWWDLFGWRKSG